MSRGSVLKRVRRLLLRRRKIDPKLDPEEIIRELIRQERSRLKSSGAFGHGTAAETRNRIRYARRKASELAHELLGRKRGGRLEPDVLVAQYRESPLLDAVVQDRKDAWVPTLERSRDQVIEFDLENFSFLDNPAGTITYLKQLAAIGCTATNARLHFRDDRCLDIGAYLVLGEVWPCLAPFFTGGRMPASIQKVMEAVGLRRLMNMRLKAVRDLNDIWAFPVRQRRPFGQHRSDQWIFEAQRDQVAADELCDAVDQWLGVPDPPHELTEEGRAWISTIILELLNNAQRHSDPATGDGSWAVAAFMAKTKQNGADLFQCHIGILSVGATIDESLRTCSPSTAQQLDSYVTLQARSKVCHAPPTP